MLCCDVLYCVVVCCIVLCCVVLVSYAIMCDLRWHNSILLIGKRVEIGLGTETWTWAGFE